jgi:hypothetical protein
VTVVDLTMSFDDYLTNPAYGSSELRLFRAGIPAVVQWRRKNRPPDTDATRIGRAAHCAILTPELFAATFIVKPEGMEFRSNADKALRDKWIAEGKTILTQQEWAQVEAVVRAFHGKPAAHDALERAEAIEASVFWTDPSGIARKGRPDWWDDHAVSDLKVSIEAEKGFSTLVYKAHRNGWFNQLASNWEGLAANGLRTACGRLVVIAPNPPQDLRVWLLEVCEADLEFLAMENQDTARAIGECERTGVWSGTPDDWQRIELPAGAGFEELDMSGVEEAHDHE